MFFFFFHFIFLVVFVDVVSLILALNGAFAIKSRKRMEVMRMRLIPLHVEASECIICMFSSRSDCFVAPASIGSRLEIKVC